MIKSLKKYYFKQQFDPDLFGLLINPFYFARKGLVKNIKLLTPYINGKTLDVGCGSMPYKKLFTTTEYIGMDIEQSGHDHRNENIDVFYDGKTFPFSDNTFDSIISNQVLEHVFAPNAFLSEIRRTLKKDRFILITVPFVWDEHEQPYDFARYSSFGLKFIMEQNGFEIIEHRKSVSDIRVVFQLLCSFIFKITQSKSSFLNAFLCLILISPFNIIGEICGFLLPSNKDLYLDNVIIAKKL